MQKKCGQSSFRSGRDAKNMSNSPVILIPRISTPVFILAPLAQYEALLARPPGRRPRHPGPLLPFLLPVPVPVPRHSSSGARAADVLLHGVAREEDVPGRGPRHAHDVPLQLVRSGSAGDARRGPLAQREARGEREQRRDDGLPALERRVLVHPVGGVGVQGEEGGARVGVGERGAGGGEGVEVPVGGWVVSSGSGRRGRKETETETDRLRKSTAASASSSCAISMGGAGPCTQERAGARTGE